MEQFGQNFPSSPADKSSARLGLGVRSTHRLGVRLRPFQGTAGSGRDSPAPIAANSCFSQNLRVKQGRGRTLFTVEEIQSLPRDHEEAYSTAARDPRSPKTYSVFLLGKELQIFF